MPPYDPDQPRVPPGNADGGQWTSGGSTTQSRDAGEVAPQDGDLSQEEADAAYKRREVPEDQWIHGRAGRQDLDTGYVVLGTKDVDVADQYAGRNGSVWYLRPGPNRLDLRSPDSPDANRIVARMRRDWEVGALSHIDSSDVTGPDGEFDEAAVRAAWSPADIVDSAGAFDNPSWTAWLADRFDPAAAETPDGLVVMDIKRVSAVKVSEEARVSESAFREAKDDEGTTWEVTLIRAGASVNRNYYPDAVLREAAPLFDGVKVFAKSDRDHIEGAAKDVRNIVGWISGPRFVEGASADTGEVRGTLHLVESASIRGPLVDAWKRGKRDLMGLSIDAHARTKARRSGETLLREATRMTKINSVDVIVEPSAGGAFVRLVESVESDPMRERLIAKIKQAPKTAAKIADLGALTDEELEQRYTEAVAELSGTGTPAGAAAAAGATAPPVTAEDLRMVEARIHATTAIAASTLPQPAKDRLVRDFAGRARFSTEDVDAAIKGEREYLGRFVESGAVRLPDFGEGARAEDRHAKIATMWDDFFAGKNGVHSLKECYIETTGDKRVTGRVADCDRSRLAEAAGDARIAEAINMTALADVLGAAMQRRMVEDYAQAIAYDSWRAIVNVVPRSDFRTNELTRMGGYGNLPAVNESAAYAALTSPDDEKATYAVTKRGGTETVTLEVIRNDDVRAVRQIPMRMAYAAKRTLHEFVFDFVRTNPTLYDSVAFFHATHGNLGSAALDATSWSAARLAMLKQTEAGSSKRLGIAPKILLVPVDLEETANNLFVRSTNNDPTFVQNQRVQIISIPYWTDVTDWAAFADPRESGCIEIGFLDGREEPELFVQDMPNVGSLFSNDQHTYKIRHIYGGQVYNYRGGYKAVVAG